MLTLGGSQSGEVYLLVANSLLGSPPGSGLGGLYNAARDFNNNANSTGIGNGGDLVPQTDWEGMGDEDKNSRVFSCIVFGLDSSSEKMQFCFVGRCYTCL